MKASRSLLRLLVIVGGVLVLLSTPNPFLAQYQQCYTYGIQEEYPCPPGCNDSYAQYQNEGPGNQILESAEVCTAPLCQTSEGTLAVTSSNCCTPLNGDCSSNAQCCGYIAGGNGTACVDGLCRLFHTERTLLRNRWLLWWVLLQRKLVSRVRS